MKSAFTIIFIFTIIRVGAAEELPKDLNDAFAKADKLIIYQVLPHIKNGDFHNTQINDQKIVNNRASISEITSHLRSSILENITPAFCFNPHHGVRICYGNKTLDLLICYECHAYQLYLAGKKPRYGSFSGKSNTLDRYLDHR